MQIIVDLCIVYLYSIPIVDYILRECAGKFLYALIRFGKHTRAQHLAAQLLYFTVFIFFLNIPFLFKNNISHQVLYSDMVLFDAIARKQNLKKA